MTGISLIGVARGVLVLLLSLPGLASFGQRSFDAARRVSSVLRDQNFRNGIYVLVSDRSGFEQWMKENLPSVGFIRSSAHSFIYRIPAIDRSGFRRLEYAPLVKFMESLNRYPRPERELTGIDLSLNGVNAVHHFFESVTGDGLSVSIKEEAFDKADIDFKGRVLDPDAIPSSPSTHATNMATIIAGGGNTSPDGKGVAWKALMDFSDFANLLPDDDERFSAKGISVQNHSYGVGIENYYGIESFAYDKQCRAIPELLHVFSAGNAGLETSTEGPYAGIAGFANLTGHFKMSKNTISVGGVDRLGVISSLSSRGPAHDGRVKPETTAFGAGGTSEAAAIVAGISLLLQDAYRSSFGKLPPSDLLKAVLINSSVDRGRPGVDYEYGFGVVNALRAVQTIQENKFFLYPAFSGTEIKFSINIPTHANQLKVTLVWNDPEADAGSGKALVNDLDLEVTEVSSANVFRPWVLSSFPHLDSLRKNARRGPDHVNNVEHITIENVQPGEFTVSVKGFGTFRSPQSFSVAYEVSSSPQWMFPTTSDAIPSDEEIILRWDSQKNSGTATLEWKYTDTNEWIYIQTVDLSDDGAAWRTPAGRGLVQVRLRNEENILIASPSFIVSRKPVVTLLYKCPDEALLSWANVNMPAYHIFSLGEKYLQKVGITSDTLYKIVGSQPQGTYFSVAPVDSIQGLMSRTINFSGASQGCYLNSFLPRELVTDSVILDLKIGTNVGLQSIIFERLSGSGFVVLQTLAPPGGKEFALKDLRPVPGPNYYRVRIVRDNGQVVESQLEQVIYTRQNDITFYPNPVRQGEPVFVVVDSDQVQFRVYDFLGRLIEESSDDGEIKTIEAGLPRGTYIIRAITPDRTLSGRLIVY